jgi:flagellar secretion chaperone FliS
MNAVKRGYLAYQEAQAHDLDQAKLVLMMFAGAIRFLDRAVASETTDPAERERYISRAKNVILELISSLDIDRGGEMGPILLRAYRGLFMKLNAAHLGNDTAKIVEVRNSLAELEESWRQVFTGPEYQKFLHNRTRLHAECVRK